jgi:DNA mismatch endonuclease, patch repair protein
MAQLGAGKATSSIGMSLGLSRSEQMSRIRGQDTTAERFFRRSLWHRGYRYRVNARTPVGLVDVAFTRQCVAIYVDGCFWHGCPEHYVRPRTNSGFWNAKLRKNVDRDRKQSLELERLGWRVVRLWEHQVWDSLDEAIGTAIAALTSPEWQPSPSWRVVRVDPVDPIEDTEKRFMEDLRDPCLIGSKTEVRSTKKWNTRIVQRATKRPRLPSTTRKS